MWGNGFLGKSGAFQSAPVSRQSRGMKTPVLSLDDLKPVPPKCIRAKTRACIALIVVDGHTPEDAIREAGVRPDFLERALRNPEVQNYIQALANWKLRREHAARASYIFDAIDKAHEVMASAESESLRMRAIEFISKHAPQHSLASSASPDPAPVAAQVSPMTPGYAYKRPADTQSDAARDDDQ